MSDVTINYKGASIATMDASGTKTLLTEGKYCEDDIEVVYIQPSGGGAEWNDVNFWDYDGTLLYSYSAADFASLSALPANPTHDGLTAQGWNWTLATAKTQVATYGFLDIGQLYTPSSGNTEFLVRILTTDEVFVWLSKSSAAVASIDWGDGSEQTSVTYTSDHKYTHTYASPGDYVISIIVTGGTVSLYGSWDTNFIGLMTKPPVNARLLEAHFNAGVKNATYANQQHPLLRAVTFSSDYAGTAKFENCAGLQCLILPSGATSFGGRYLTGLRTICLSGGVDFAGTFRDGNNVRRISCSGILNLETYAFANSYALTDVGASLSSSINTDHTFQNCRSLNAITLPSGLTTIGNGMFEAGNTLQKMTVPSTVTSIAANAFATCGIKEYHFLPTAPPTLSNVSAFSNILASCVMYVPYSADHSVLNAYKTASNWSTYASYIYEEAAP